MILLRQLIEETRRLDGDGAQLGDAAEKFPGGHTQPFRKRHHRRKRGIAFSALDTADVVRGKASSFGELLEGQAEALAPPSDRVAELHDREGAGCMRRGERPIEVASNTIVVRCAIVTAPGGGRLS